MARRRQKRFVRIGLWSLATLFGLLIVAVATVLLSFDADSFKPRVVAAVKQATGRDLTLHGPIRLGLSLQPTLIVQDVSFANPPGFSQPQMATLQQLELKLALLPLLDHRVEIRRLVLVKPDILLETDAQGRPNWTFAPEAGPSPAQQVATANTAPGGTPTSISIADVRITDGTLTWRDGKSGRAAVVALGKVELGAASPDANVRLTAAASYDGTPFSVIGEVGPLARLQDSAATTPWPVQLSLEALGAKLALDGTIKQPLLGRGYAGKLTASVPDVAALAPLLPSEKLPALHDVRLAGQFADTGTPLPQVSGLTLHIGQSDLSATVAGLRLDKLDVTAAQLDQPVQIAAQGSVGNAPVSLAGTIGAPAALLPGGQAPTPLPIDLTLQALGSTLTVKGTAVQARDGRPSLQADIVADTIDLDSATALFAKVPAPSPSPTPSSAATPSAAPVASPVKPAANGRLIPDTPIRFELLRVADASMKLRIGQLKSRGAVYRSISGQIELHGGKLQVDPITADLPEGHVDAALSADAMLSPPSVALRLRSPALAVHALLAALGEPATITGNLQVMADLRGAGATPHAIASSLGGSLSASMANGTVDNRLLGSALGSVLREASLLDLVGRGGTSQINCFLLRVEAKNGIAAVRTGLSSSLLTMDGDGSVNLGAETIDLRLRPQARVAGNSVVVPLRISGPLRAPATTTDAAAAVAQNAGTVAALLGNTTPLGLVAGALGGQRAPGSSGGGECGGGQPAGAQQPAASQKLPNVGGVLKQLFR